MRTATRRRLYGRTKPGTLLKHQIPVRTERWDVDQPGWGEIDLVSHSGSCGDGEFAHSMNFTDIHSTWVETRAVLGKGQAGILAALETIRKDLPFRLWGLDSDNGSEFINHHVVAFCNRHKIQFTRGRPYKKDDNAHVEQKNWTHVRRLVGWERIDTRAAVDLLNELYCNEWRWMMNFVPALGQTAPQGADRISRPPRLRRACNPARPTAWRCPGIFRVPRRARRAAQPTRSVPPVGSDPSKDRSHPPPRSPPLIDLLPHPPSRALNGRTPSSILPLEGEDAPTRRSKMPTSKKPSVRSDLARRSPVRSDSYLTRQGSSGPLRHRERRHRSYHWCHRSPDRWRCSRRRRSAHRR